MGVFVVCVCVCVCACVCVRVWLVALCLFLVPCSGLCTRSSVADCFLLSVGRSVREGRLWKPLLSWLSSCESLRLVTPAPAAVSVCFMYIFSPTSEMTDWQFIFVHALHQMDALTQHAVVVAVV